MKSKIVIFNFLFQKKYPSLSLCFSEIILCRWNNLLRLVFWTGIVGENLRSTSGLELRAQTLLAGAYSLTNGEL